MKHDVRLDSGNMSFERSVVANIATPLVGSQPQYVPMIRRCRRIQCEAGQLSANTGKPQCKPTPLEARMAGQQDPSVPVDIVEQGCSQTRHGGLVRQSSSSRFLSRS